MYQRKKRKRLPLQNQRIFCSRRNKQKRNVSARQKKDIESIRYEELYKQLVRSVWRPIKVANGHYKTNHFKAEVKITERAEHVIEEFLKPNTGKATAEVNEAIMHLFSNYEPLKPTDSAQTSFWSDAVVDAVLPLIPIVLIFCFGLSIWILLRSSWLRVVWPLFYCSWVWTWIFLYKSEVAKRRAKMLTKSSGIVCASSSEIDWWKALGRYLHSFVAVLDDDCAELQQIYTVDPMLEVSPTMALSHMIIKTLVEPAEVIASAITRFIRVILRDLPTIPAYLIIFIVIFFILAFVLFLFNYRIRAPFISIEPSPRAAPGSADTTLDECHSLLLDLERRHSALELIGRQGFQQSPTTDGGQLQRRHSDVYTRSLSLIGRRKPRYGGRLLNEKSTSKVTSSESESASDINNERVASSTPLCEGDVGELD